MSKTVLKKCYPVENSDIWRKICKSWLRKLETNKVHFDGWNLALAHVNKRTISAPEIFEDCITWDNIVLTWYFNPFPNDQF